MLVAGMADDYGMTDDEGERNEGGKGESEGSLRIVPFVAGAVAVLAHYSLSDQVVFRSELGKSFLYLSWRESLFWLSHYLLLVPGLLAMAWGLAPRLGPAVVSLWHRLQGFTGRSARRRRLVLLLFAASLFAVSFLGRKAILQDLPITNDEYTLRFGAAILAQGEVTAPDVDPAFAFSMPFVFRHQGRIASMDFPGTMLVLAAGRVTGWGHGLVALLVALSGTALVASCRRLDGDRGLWVAATAWLLSPMVWTLSMTEHSQLMSRVWIAFAWAVWIGRFWRAGAEDVGNRGDPVPRAWLWGALLGLFTAFAFASRPAETGMVMAPVAAHLLWRAFDPRRPGAVLGAAATSVLGPLFLLWWNVQTTGRWNVSARVLSNRTLGDPFWESLFHRLGGNLGFNVMMLTLFFLGPAMLLLGLAAWRQDEAQGGDRDGALARLCAAALSLQLLLALFHSDTGNHLVGPIHYSEAAVPLLVLAVLGWRHLPRRRLFRWLSPASAATLTAAYLLGIVLWSGIQSATLLDQSLVQRLHLDAVADLEDAVVVADRPYRLWFARPEVGAVASWVADLPHPDPYLRSDVLFAYPEADLDALRRAFPERRLYRMTYSAEGEPVRVVPLRLEDHEENGESHAAHRRHGTMGHVTSSPSRAKGGSAGTADGVAGVPW